MATLLYGCDDILHFIVPTHDAGCMADDSKCWCSWLHSLSVHHKSQTCNCYLLTHICAWFLSETPVLRRLWFCHVSANKNGKSCREKFQFIRPIHASSQIPTRNTHLTYFHSVSLLTRATGEGNHGFSTGFSSKFFANPALIRFHKFITFTALSSDTFGCIK